MQNKLNVGCGEKLKNDWINIDKFVPEGFDNIDFGDIEIGLDYPNESFDEILLDNVIEHLRDIPACIAEIHRLLKPGGSCTLITPHFSSASSWRDPTHIHHFSYFSFDYFSTGSRSNYLGTKFNIEKKLSFGGGIGLIGRVLFKLSPSRWEEKYSFIFRASTITIKLIKENLDAS